MSHLYFGCVCITHNRPKVLPEVIESFLRQKYTNAELVIFDDADQYPSQEGGRWKLISTAKRFETTGQKRDYLIRNLFSSKVNAIANFDDDDIAFSNYLSVLAENFESGVDVVCPSYHCQLIGPQKYVYDMPLEQNLRKGWLTHRGGWLLSAYLLSGGYPPHAHHADDQELMSAFIRSGKNVRFTHAYSHDAFYMTRSYSEYGHLSWNQYPDTDVARIEKQLSPHWREKYESDCRTSLLRENDIMKVAHFIPKTVGYGFLHFGKFLGYDGLSVASPHGVEDCGFLSVHAPSCVVLKNLEQLRITGFLNGSANRQNRSPVTFILDGSSIGECYRALDTTNEILVPAGQHILEVSCESDNRWCHSLWAFRT